MSRTWVAGERQQYRLDAPVDWDSLRPLLLVGLGLALFHLVILLCNYLARQQTTLRTRELALLKQVVTTAGTMLEPHGVLQVACCELARAHDLSRVTVTLLDKARGQNTVMAEHLSDDCPSVLGMTVRVADDPVIQRVLEFKDPVSLSDSASFPPQAAEPRAGRKGVVASRLVVPLLISGDVVGTISLDSCRRRRFTPLRTAQARDIASAVAQSLENAQCFAAERAAHKLSSTLSEIARVLNAAPDLDAALNLVLFHMERVIALDSGSILLLEGDQMRVVAVRGFAEPEQVLGKRLNLSVAHLNRQVLETRRPLVVGLVADDSRWCRSMESSGLAPALERIKSWMGVPLLFQDRVIGMLTADKEEQDFYTERDAELALAFAGHAAVAIETARLLASEREQLRLAQILQQVGALLITSLGLDQVMERIFDLLAQVVAYDAVSVQLLDETGMVNLVASRASSNSEDAHRGAELVADSAWIERWRDRAVMVIPDTDADEHWVSGTPDRQVKSWMGAALRVKEQLVGVLNLESATRNAFGEKKVEMVAAFANQAAVAIENARLYERAQQEISARRAVEDALRHRTAQLEALNAIIAAAVAADDQHELLSTALDHTLKALEVQAGGIWSEGFRAVRGISSAFVQANIDVWRAPGLDGQGILVAEDWHATEPDSTLASFCEVMMRHGVRASLSAPILIRERRIGGLGVASREPRAWSSEEIALVEAAGQQVGAAVERVQLLDRIRAQALQVHRIVDTVPEGVVLLTADGHVLLANPAARRCLPYLTSSQVGDVLSNLGSRPLRELLGPPPADSTWNDVTVAGPPVRSFEVAAHPLRAGTDTAAQRDLPGSWVLVLRDVTREREAQQQVQRQERLAAVGQLAAGIAHDFNNIMAVIVLYTQMCMRDLSLEPRVQERLETILAQAQRAAELIQQILDFSRRAILERRPLELAPFLNEQVKLLQRTLPENIRLQYDHGGTSYLVNADPTRIQQMVLNLTLNARDAMPDGGDMTIRLERLRVEPGDRPPMLEMEPGDWVHIVVADSGGGIPPEAMPHIFEPFFTTKAPLGTGLGLSQVYGIVRQHGGHISVESPLSHGGPDRQEHGTAFDIYLPVLSIPRPPRFDSVSPSMPEGSGETILVVEDDAATREALVSGLEVLNYRALSAENGRRALELFGQHREQISLVLSDLVMPEMGGVDLFRALRIQRPGIKLVALAGYPLDQVEELRQEGIVGLLQKPVSLDQLAQSLGQALQNDQSPCENG